MQHVYRAFATVLIVALAACSGNGSNSSSTVPTVNPPTQQYQMAKVKVSASKPVKTPAAFERLYKQFAKTHPHFVSPNTTKIIFTLNTVNGLSAAGLGFNQTVTLVFSGGGQNCTLTTGNEQCTATTTAPVGTDCWTVQGQSATQTLASTAVCQAIAVGANSVSVTLNPIVKTLAWSTASVSVGNGTAAGNSVTAEALDASGSIIIPTQTGQTEFQIPLYLKSDGLTIDYLGYQCSSSAMKFYTSATHITAAQGNTAAFTDGIALSTPDSTQTGTNHQNTPGGASITAVGNNGAFIYYDGTAQTAGTTTMTCTLSDSQGDTAAVFTANLQNGTTGWTVN